MRKLVAFAAGVVALASLGIAAGASTTPPTGTLSCGTTGTVTFKPALTPTTPAKKPTSVKIHKAAVDTCDSGGVAGGKATINGGSIVLNAKIAPGADCQAVAAGTAMLANPVLTLKLTNTTGSKTETVAVVKPTNLVVMPQGAGFHATGTLPQTKAMNKPFGGETFETQINVDNLSDFAGCLGGTNNVDHIDFSTAGGSTLSIHP
jgi:hypothetical protein